MRTPFQPALSFVPRFSGTLLLAVLVVGCRPVNPAAKSPPPAPSVTVARAETRPWVDHDEFTGRVDAVETVEIRPRVSGYLDEVRFQSGAAVRKGDVLFVIDRRPFVAALQRAEGEIEQSRVRLAWAQREATRANQLLATRAVSREEAELRETRVAEAHAAVTVSEAALATAKLNLDYTEIRSPIDGRVSRALVTIGNNVSGVDGFTTLLTTVVSMDPMHVYVDVDESTLLKYRRLTREGKLSLDQEGHVEVELALVDDAGYARRGRVESLDNRLDPGTGSIVLRAVFPNPDGALIPGMFARLRVPGGAKGETLLIPESAVGTDQSQKFVLTLTSSNTVAYRPVKLGPLVSGMRVVRDGLTAGDQVVVNGLMRVRPGMMVTPLASETRALETAAR